MTRILGNTLIALLVAISAPIALAQASPLLEQDEPELEIINGVPVNPELRARLMDTERALNIQEVIELTQRVLDDQQAAEEQARQQDRGWMGQDPLGHLGEEMQSLAEDIDRGQTADPTQARGEDVLRKMDTLIALLEEAAQASGSGGAGQGQGQGQGPGQGNNPANDSTLAKGSDASGDLNAKGQGNNRFEDLDPAQREAILRAQQDQQGLPPEYDALLAEYYRRLATENALEKPEEPVQPQESSGDD